MLRIVTILVALLLALPTVAFAPRPAWAAQTFQNVGVSLDRTVFLSSVPSYAVLGHNYTVKLLVRNDLNKQVPIILRVDGPVSSIYTHPLFQQLVVGPGQHLLVNFSLIAYNTSSGVLNVTAIMWVWFFDQMSRPQVVEQISTLINGVMPSPVAHFVLLVTVVVLISVALFALVSLRTRGERTAGFK